MVILPLGYTVSEVFAAGGNPYGTSFTSGKTIDGPDVKALAAARYQGQRLARYAAVIAEGRGETPSVSAGPGRSAFTRPRCDESQSVGVQDAP